MTIGLLIVTHNNIGNDLVDTATAMLGVCPLATEILAVSQNCDPELLRRKAKQLIAALDQGLPFGRWEEAARRFASRIFDGTASRLGEAGSLGQCLPWGWPNS